MNIKSIIESIRLDLDIKQQQHLVLKAEVGDLILKNEQAKGLLSLLSELPKESVEELERLLQENEAFKRKFLNIGAGYRGSDQKILSMHDRQIAALRAKFEPTRELLEKNEWLLRVYKEKIEAEKIIKANKSSILAKSLEMLELDDVIQQRLKLIGQLTAIVDVDPLLSSGFDDDDFEFDVNNKNVDEVVHKIVSSILSSSSFDEGLKGNVDQFEEIVKNLSPLVDKEFLQKALRSFMTKNDKLFTIPRDPLPPEELKFYADVMDEHYPKRDTSQSQYKKLHASIEAMRDHGLKINDARVVHLATTLRHQLNDFEDNPKRVDDAEKQKFSEKFLTTLRRHDSEFAKHRHGALRQLLGAIHKYVCTNISLIREKKPLQPLSFFQKTARETQVGTIEADFKKEVGEPKSPK